MSPTSKTPQERTTGTILRFIRSRGYGFIGIEGTNEVVWFHVKGLSTSTRRLRRGDEVTFLLRKATPNKTAFDIVLKSSRPSPTAPSTQSSSSVKTGSSSNTSSQPRPNKIQRRKDRKPEAPLPQVLNGTSKTMPSLATPSVAREKVSSVNHPSPIPKKPDLQPTKSCSFHKKASTSAAWTDHQLPLFTLFHDEATTENAENCRPPSSKG